MKTEKKTTITLFKSPFLDVCGLVCLILLFAKVFGYADISWWIVTCPIWGPFVFSFALFSVCYSIFFMVCLFMVIILGLVMFLEFLYYTSKKLLGRFKKQTDDLEINEHEDGYPINS